MEVQGNLHVNNWIDAGGIWVGMGDWLELSALIIVYWHLQCLCIIQILSKLNLEVTQIHIYVLSTLSHLLNFLN